MFILNSLSEKVQSERIHSTCVLFHCCTRRGLLASRIKPYSSIMSTLYWKTSGKSAADYRLANRVGKDTWPTQTGHITLVTEACGVSNFIIALCKNIRPDDRPIHLSVTRQYDVTIGSI